MRYYCYLPLIYRERGLVFGNDGAEDVQNEERYEHFTEHHHAFRPRVRKEQELQGGGLVSTYVYVYVYVYIYIKIYIYIDI